MELGDRFCSVGKVLRRFPGAFMGSVALPMDEIFHLAMSDARIKNVVHFPLHVVLKFHGRWGRLYSTRKTVLPMRLEERYVKNWVDAYLCG